MASNYYFTTLIVFPDSLSSRRSPKQAITPNLLSNAKRTFFPTISLVSPNNVLLSECPIITHGIPKSLT